MSTERPWAPQQKADKSTVFYERGDANNRCGRCCYFLGSTCDLVDGLISPNAVCRRFELPAQRG